MGLTAEQVKLADELAEVYMSKSAVDKSAFSFTELSPELQKAVVGGLLGAGVGGVSGMLTDKPNRYVLRNALLGGLLGGGAGYFLPKAVESTPDLLNKIKEETKQTPEDVKWNRRLGGAVAGGTLSGAYAGAREGGGFQKQIFTEPTVTNLDTSPVKQLMPLAERYMPSKSHYSGMAAARRQQIDPKTMNPFEVSKNELLANALDALAKEPPSATGLAGSIQGELSRLQTPVGARPDVRGLNPFTAAVKRIGSAARNASSLNPFRLAVRHGISIPGAEKRLLDTAKQIVMREAAAKAESLRRNAIAAVAKTSPNVLSASKNMQAPLRHSQITAEELGAHASKVLPELLGKYGPQIPRGAGEGILPEASRVTRNLYAPETGSVSNRVGGRALAGAGVGFALAPSLFSLLGWDQPAAPETTVP